MKKIIAFVLLLSLLLSLAACTPPRSNPKNPSASTGTTTSTQPSTTVNGGGGQQPDPDDPDNPGGSGEVDPPLFLDSVPTKNFGGTVITVNLHESYLFEVYKEEAAPDACDVAIRNRNEKIENRFNVRIEPDYVIGQGVYDHCSYIRNWLNNGDARFDLTLTQLWLTGPLATSGFYLDLRYEVPYVKDSIGTNPWWNPGINDAFTIRDRQYIGMTDINLSAIQLTWCVLFNKELVSDSLIAEGLGETDMYGVVKNNKWTLDTLYNVTKDLRIDNPQGNTPGRAGSDDIFGLLAHGTWWAEIAIASTGLQLVANNGQAYPDLEHFGLFESVSTQLFQISSSEGFLLPTSQNGVNATNKFAASEALFYMAPISALENDRLHNSLFEVGVLPMPKNSTLQHKYYAANQDAASVIGVPASADAGGNHYDAVCSVLEALAAESHNSVLPAYYDVILRDGGSRNEADREMLDLIYAGRVSDLAALHSSADDELKFSLNGVPTGLMYVLRQFAADPDLCGSAWGGSNGILDARLDDIVATYEGLYTRR